VIDGTDTRGGKRIASATSLGSNASGLDSRDLSDKWVLSARYQEGNRILRHLAAPHCAGEGCLYGAI